MTITFRPATRENVGLLIGLIGPSGGGKTYSAMRLASGIVGEGKRFAVIDTEARRALHYADRFAFDHAELRAPFRPAAYVEAIKAADAAGYGAILIDSFSHVWAGEGGVLDWQDEELQRMAGDDWAKRERVKMAAWIKPKTAHKQMVQSLLQVRAHLIICLRAEEKTKIEKDDRGKQVIVPQGFQPICDKSFPFELTCSFMLLPNAPGVPVPIKMQDQHAVAFPAGRPIDEASGRALSEWASGGTMERVIDPPPQPVTQGKYVLLGRGTDDLEKWRDAFIAKIQQWPLERATKEHDNHREIFQAMANGTEEEAAAMWAVVDAFAKKDK